VLAKSPATGGFGEAYTGGFIAHELKYAGYDGIVVQGKAPEPVYLAVRNDKVEIRPASHLWGQPTLEVERKIRDESGDVETRIVSVGPAGEKGVRFACVMKRHRPLGGPHGHGRGDGLEKPQGDRGPRNRKSRAGRPQGLREHALANLAKIKKHPWLGDSAGRLGTAGGVEGSQPTEYSRPATGRPAPGSTPTRSAARRWPTRS